MSFVAHVQLIVVAHVLLVDHFDFQSAFVQDTRDEHVRLLSTALRLRRRRRAVLLNATERLRGFLHGHLLRGTHFVLPQDTRRTIHLSFRFVSI